ncbi:MAG: c-type cytochrome, partial [Acidimicrobiales bacterium]
MLSRRIEPHWSSMAGVWARRAFIVTSTAALAMTVAAGCTVDAPAAPTEDPQLVLGQQVYEANCASCHGSSGQG